MRSKLSGMLLRITLAVVSLIIVGTLMRANALPLCGMSTGSQNVSNRDYCKTLAGIDCGQSPLNPFDNGFKYHEQIDKEIYIARPGYIPARIAGEIYYCQYSETHENFKGCCWDAWGTGATPCPQDTCESKQLTPSRLITFEW